MSNFEQVSIYFENIFIINVDHNFVEQMGVLARDFS